MQISFWSSTGTTETTLLERADGFLQGIAKSIAGLHTLRKGKRNIGPIRAEEYLIAASANGERSYGFKWESQGKDDSLASPTLSLELNVLERGEGDDGNPPPPAFESDEEALELWDAILDSIRLRPGAA
ncbi:hypothetical protein CSC70_03160 [Pseudoxanthomonas kalamensis DSM 18571]|nr:hypothetical protein CSC70_03160 [Pseudoxanthomonas kalamensis DSM 18571]